MRATLVGLMALLGSGPTLAQEAAGDPEAGHQVAGMCQTCHGLDGYAQIPVAPHIGGESGAYLVEQLLAFRSGERENEMMSVVAKNLTDEKYLANVVRFTSTTDFAKDTARIGNALGYPAPGRQIGIQATLDF